MIGIGISIPMMMPFAEDATAFVRAGVLREPLAITRAQISGVQSTAINGGNNGLTFYGADVPRFNGPAQRLLIEGQGTNTIRNPGAEGAIAGTPGTMPTNWVAAAGGAGLSWNVAGSGFEGDAPYVDIRLSGTSSSVAGPLIRADQVYPVASVGQVWSHSVSIRIVSGSLTGISSVNLLVTEWTSGSTFLSLQSAAVSVSTLFQRQSITATLAQATVGRVGSQITVTPQIGVAIDCTFRIIAPQLELGLPSSPILPPVGTPGASTRGDDRVTASLASLGIAANGACTILWSGVVPNLITGATHTIACLDDGSVSNHCTMRIDQASGQLQAQFSFGGAGGTANAGAVTAGAAIKGGMVWNGSGRVAVSLNGGAVASVTGGPSPGLTRLQLGNLFDGSAPMWGETTRFRLLPFVSDSDLQTLTGAMP